LRISVRNSNKPKFLVGLPDSVPNYSFDISALAVRDAYHQRSCRHYHIYPGEHFDITSTSANPDGTYYLQAFGNVVETKGAASLVSPFVYIKDYSIRIVQIKKDIARFKHVLEDVGKDLYFEHMLDIKFVGDLNYDSVPDILFTHVSRHSAADTYLFMSGYSEKELLTKVAINSWYNCY
jgi:hypothetical protein